MYVGLHVKSLFLCCDFNLTRNLSTNFSKTPNMQYLENSSFFMRTNGQTGLAKLVGAFRSFEP